MLAEYEKDIFVYWPYTRTLLSFRQGDEAAAHAALKKAWDANPHVPDLLLGVTFLPEEPADAYTVGSPEEAHEYFLEAAAAWKATRGALEWLDKSVRPLRRKTRKRR